MKYLFLANRVPYPPYRGDKLKIFNLAKRLSKQHELHLIAFAQSKEDLIYKEELKKIFTEVHFVYLPLWLSVINCLTALWNKKPFQVLYFSSAKMRKTIKKVLSANRFDAIHVQHLRMSQYLMAYKKTPRILDLPDAFSLYWERRIKVQKNPFLKLFETIEQKRVLHYEAVIKDYDLSLVCSLEDKEYLQRVHQFNNIELLPNGVDVDIFKSDKHDYKHNHTILFTGNMDYAPNIDAVIYFVNDIFPIIQKSHPEVKFMIAGQKPVPDVTKLASSKIIVTGFVEDLAAVYNQATIVVAPLRFGAGTQNKVLEAMATGVPVVCTQIGFKGLGVDSGEGVIMQTDPNAFATSVIQLLDSAALRQKVGCSGVRVVMSKFNWDPIAVLLDSYLQNVSSSKRP